MNKEQPIKGKEEKFLRIGWDENSSKGVRCRDKVKGKFVYAYHIDDHGMAYNKNKTLCIGCLFSDLAVEPLKKLRKP